MSDLLRTRGLLRAERLSADRWRSQAERYARLLARDRFALARVKAERDDLRAEVRERRAAEEAMHSWDGLMALLDEHWPESIFPTLPDNEDRDPGPRIVSLIRWVDQRRAAEEQVLNEAAVERAVVAFLDARPRETDMDDMTGRETWDAAPQWWRDTRTRQMRAALTTALGGDQ